ncbi:methyl-accepting chemotaxis protein [Maridesulfovibrio salexigens]|uniref:Methyl-accepting chemotaxis sensory transducer with Pas/Pac sensor n=1 Tax=Maridesulfovibrio salexigens (strain ATCC 14822 / DSM 2638 / NCIMB 8403 / VKM B-1763) TaxID=526222 RepID=C6BXW2_MARSD|nr:methyl-accepting chemotaxis protein [Maridesulfovibrio salexigens]ACS78670.1 methyl-accepting chemotaxis sensory transducer with Pas/Pac sensor [Maridesulfovibrio salexigens DSM 2638]
MKFIKTSLGNKVMVLTSLLTATAFIVLFLANSFWQRTTMMEEIERNAYKTADMLQLAIREPMAKGDNRGTTEKFATVSKKYSDVAIYLTNFKGNVTYSTNTGDIRSDIKNVIRDKDINTLVGQSLKKNLKSGLLSEIGGKEVFVEVETIQNEKACYHCHGRKQPVLGTLVMVQDVSPQFATFHESQFKGAALSFGGFVSLLAALLFFMRRSIVKRIQIISGATSDFAKGNLDAQFAVNSSDELGSLGDHLGEMARQIKDQLVYNRGVLNGITVPMIVTDGDSKIDFVNAPMRDILNKPEDVLIGMDVGDFFRVEGKSLTQEAISSSDCPEGLLRFNREDGVEFPLRYQVCPLLNAEEETVGAIAVMVDLTEEEASRKHIEQQQESLLEVANEVTEVSKALLSYTTELSQQMNELTAGVDTTAMQTGQVATAMEEMNATVLEVAQNTGETAEASDRANSVARDGGKVVSNTVSEIHIVTETTDKLSDMLADLSERAINIGEVMSVINDIADQTNLLALNAAIEAARAGEAGRGFAVVADEVRKLAEKTMGATNEVESAITLIQQSTDKVVSEMSGVRGRVENTVQMAEGAGGVLSQIVSESETIADMVRAIATAAEQQTATSDEINNSVTEINGLSQALSDGIQNANSNIQEVAEMAQKLSQLVERFK